ncbi:MAG: hypothetical protein M0P91_08330 [Sulfuricurvum sp.]|uniref:hypothetical protein n=1 Tax=Sulfuricurvum sp. TaxID=2025608 RepID=UPI0025D09566|nr:hypothetical protein [Sulfuricurvum sp.]MCK9373191.1 hypothetical protein [Sulfuricurvum sp.]
MDKSTSFWILPLFLTPYLYGEGTGLLTRGLYGNVEYSYNQDIISDQNNRATQNSFAQRYTLGKRGSIYSPNLLTYLLQGSFLVNESKNESSTTSGSYSTKSSNYRLNTNFLSATVYPFSVYGEKTTTPYSSVQTGSSLSYNETSDRYGINGNARLSGANLRYGFTNSNLQRDGSFDSETRNNDDYTVSISQSYTEGGVSASYSDSTRDYVRNDKSNGMNQLWSDKNRDATINGNWNIDKTLKATSILSYRDSSYMNIKNLTANANLYWTPNDKYNGGVNLNVNKMGDITNTVIGGNSNYRLTPEFMTTQNVSLYRSAGGFGDQTMGSASLGGNYSKTLENDLTVNTGVSLFAKTEKNNMPSDLNMTTRDRDMYSYTISSGASKMIKSIKTNISANVSYYDSFSTLEEKTKRFNANLMLSSTIAEDINYRLSVYYIKDENQFLSAMDGNFSYQSSEILTLDNSINYVQDIGFRGKLTMGGGVMYSVTKSDKEASMSRVAPHVSSSFTYQFFQAMFFNSMLSASQDSVSDLTNYSASMGLNYTLRMVTMSLGGRHMQQKGGTSQDRAQSSAYFKISRRF